MPLRWWEQLVTQGRIGDALDFGFLSWVHWGAVEEPWVGCEVTFFNVKDYWMILRVAWACGVWLCMCERDCGVYVCGMLPSPEVEKIWEKVCLWGRENGEMPLREVAWLFPSWTWRWVCSVKTWVSIALFGSHRSVKSASQGPHPNLCRGASQAECSGTSWLNTVPLGLLFSPVT